METAEDVVDELLNLVEASSKNPMEEFLNDLVQIPPNDMMEKSFENLLEISSRKNKIDEILDDLINATCKDEMEELLNDMAEISSNERAEEKSLIDVSIEDTMNQMLKDLMEASSEETVNQQLLKDLQQVTVNEPFEEKLKEMSKMASSKDSSIQTSFKNSLIDVSAKLMKKELPEAPIQELFIDSDSDELTSSDSELTVKFHSLPEISLISLCGPL